MNRITVYKVQLLKESSLLVNSSVIRKPEDAAMIVRQYFHRVYGNALPDREVFGALWLNTKNAVTGIETISIGSLNASIVMQRESFKGAMLHNAASVVYFHNHPSGQTDPSPEDISITERLMESGKLLGIDVLDHVIIGEEEAYCSLKERNLM